MLKFNNQLIPDFIKVKSISIQALPNVTGNVKSIAGGFGCIAGKSSFGEKILSAEVSVVIPKGQSLQSCARTLAKWLKGNNFKLSPLIVLDDADIMYMAKVNNSVELSDLVFVGTGTIEFIIPSGLGISTKQKSCTGATKVTATNSGSHTALPEISVTLAQAVTNGTVTVVHATTGDRVILNGTFARGDVININCSKHLVKVNGSVSMSIVGYSSKFFELVEGKNEVSCSVASELEVIFQERWL